MFQYPRKFFNTSGPKYDPEEGNLSKPHIVYCYYFNSREESITKPLKLLWRYLNIFDTIFFILIDLTPYFINLLISNPAESSNLFVILVFVINQRCSSTNYQKNYFLWNAIWKAAALIVGKEKLRFLSKSAAEIFQTLTVNKSSQNETSRLVVAHIFRLYLRRVYIFKKFLHSTFSLKVVIDFFISCRHYYLHLITTFLIVLFSDFPITLKQQMMLNLNP